MGVSNWTERSRSFVIGRGLGERVVFNSKGRIYLGEKYASPPKKFISAIWRTKNDPGMIRYQLTAVEGLLKSIRYREEVCRG